MCILQTIRQNVGLFSQGREQGMQMWGGDAGQHTLHKWNPDRFWEHNLMNKDDPTSLNYVF